MNSDPLPPISSVQAAKAFLAVKDDRDVTGLKMQKLIYIAHENHIIETTQPFITDRVEAWFDGPVFPALERFIGNRDHVVAEADLPRSGDVDAVTVEYIRVLWEHLKGWSGRRLSDKLHEEGTPWHMAMNPPRTFFQRVMLWEPKNPVIGIGLFRRYCHESGKWRCGYA